MASFTKQHTLHSTSKIKFLSGIGGTLKLYVPSISSNMSFPNPSPPSPADQESARTFWQVVVRLTDEKRRAGSGQMSRAAEEREHFDCLVPGIHQLCPGPASAVASYDLNLAWLQWQAVLERAEDKRGLRAHMFDFCDKAIEDLLHAGLPKRPLPTDGTLFDPVRSWRYPTEEGSRDGGGRS
ncbi:hypothetical protein LTR78_008464 [Recurvomyces mirabilis]|uniref:Uncharacterized protein n=1 Tax=Recurvomyces mirabilis TaxID=574656 RepID=A0AAE0WH01_9PEZI|nr:hypothetical protein LTR78_008464 [Recurvomyces mirabilis]KAK5155452.1 hypothetical protein LTS14_005713 [Recurvomyces mirabilis]